MLRGISGGRSIAELHLYDSGLMGKRVLRTWRTEWSLDSFRHELVTDVTVAREFYGTPLSNDGFVLHSTYELACYSESRLSARIVRDSALLRVQWKKSSFKKIQ
ncbi:uncharacterized protein LOC143214255 [Lasioglossum baleicum]|uniref:uncharacterized protein LOC143214255 n=1 Tax=Lasioglossum baleicum TaxID=434251 RepID=UPI003FCCF8E3